MTNIELVEIEFATVKNASEYEVNTCSKWIPEHTNRFFKSEWNSLDFTLSIQLQREVLLMQHLGKCNKCHAYIVRGEMWW